MFNSFQSYPSKMGAMQKDYDYDYDSGTCVTFFSNFARSKILRNDMCKITVKAHHSKIMFQIFLKYPHEGLLSPFSFLDHSLSLSSPRFGARFKSRA